MHFCDTCDKEGIENKYILLDYMVNDDPVMALLCEDCRTKLYSKKPDSEYSSDESHSIQTKLIRHYFKMLDKAKDKS